MADVRFASVFYEGVGGASPTSVCRKALDRGRQSTGRRHLRTANSWHQKRQPTLAITW